LVYGIFYKSRKSLSARSHLLVSFGFMENATFSPT